MPPTRRPTMAKLIRCECGYIARGGTDDEVVDAIQDHMRSDHPALLEQVERSEIVGWIEQE
jgi:predicted small metal-binding protein